MNKHLHATFLALLTLALVGVAGFVVFGNGGEQKKSPSGPGWGEVTFEWGPEVAAGEVEGEEVAEVAERPHSDWETYQNTTYGFQFSHPPGFSVGVIQEVGGTSIVVQSVEKKQGFQIYIRPLEEKVELTKETILADNPEITVEDEEKVLVDGVPGGLVFKSDNPHYGTSREIWFIAEGNLYQISTYLSLDSLLREVMRTWEFI